MTAQCFDGPWDHSALFSDLLSSRLRIFTRWSGIVRLEQRRAAQTQLHIFRTSAESHSKKFPESCYNVIARSSYNSLRRYPPPGSR